MFAVKVLLLSTFCVLVGCRNSILQSKSANQNQSAKIEKLSVNMERSGCYGTCPIYALSIETDGKVLFEGKGYTKITGKAEDFLTKPKIDKLIKEINKADFFSLKDEYSYDSKNCPLTATDQSTVTLTIQLNENRKTIKHYLGCMGENTQPENFIESIFPQQLFKLENKIDEIVKTKRWIGEQE